MPVKKTLWEQAVEEERQPAAKAKQGARRLRKIDTETECNKVINETKSLNGMSRLAVDGTLIDGVSFRQSLENDKRKKRAGAEDAPDFGKHYYTGKRQKYEAAAAQMTQGEAASVSSGSEQEIKAELMEAMRAWKQGNKSVLSAWLGMHSECSPKECIGILNCLASLNPSAANAEHLQLSMRMVRWLADANVKSNHPTTLQHFQTTIANVLKEFRLAQKTAKKDSLAFATKNVSLLELCIKGRDLQAILQESGSWINVSSEVDRAVQTSIGRVLFGWIQTKILQERSSAIMAASYQNMFSSRLSNEGVQQAKTNILKEVMAVPGIQALPVRRKISVGYRHIEYPTSVQSIEEEVDVRVSSFLKGELVAMGLLPAVFAEQAAIPFTPKPPKLVDEAVYKLWKEAREDAQKALGQELRPDTLGVKNVLKAEKVNLGGTDSSWVKVEGALWEHLCAGLVSQILRDKCLEMLPSEQKQCLIGEALEKVRTVMGGELCRFCPAQVQNEISLAVDYMCDLQMGIEGSIANPTSFLLNVKSLCANTLFLQDKSKVGKAAWSAKLKSLVDMPKKGVGKGSSLNEIKAQLKELHLYSWLAGADEISVLDGVTKKLLPNATDAESAKPSALGSLRQTKSDAGAASSSADNAHASQTKSQAGVVSKKEDLELAAAAMFSL